MGTTGTRVGVGLDASVFSRETHPSTVHHGSVLVPLTGDRASRWGGGGAGGKIFSSSSHIW